MILQVGKRYVSRDLVAAVILSYNHDECPWPFCGQRADSYPGEYTSYKKEGVYLSSATPDPRDLVAGYRPMPLAIVGFRRAK